MDVSGMEVRNQRTGARQQYSPHQAYGSPNMATSPYDSRFDAQQQQQYFFSQQYPRGGNGSGGGGGGGGGYYTHQPYWSPPTAWNESVLHQLPRSSRSPESSTSSTELIACSSDPEDTKSAKASRAASFAATDSIVCAGGFDTSGDAEEIPAPVSENNSYRGRDTAARSKRRPNNPSTGAGENSQSKFRKNSYKQDTYVLRVLPEDEEHGQSETPAAGATGDQLLDGSGVPPVSTLTSKEYFDIFFALSELFCRTSYRWLAAYKFKIPRKRHMKDHLRPEDRELTEYVTIIKSLVENREVPRHAVRDERLNELVSIMEGASEIRHVNIHVSRKHKPDRRVLGFIAAVNEFCWILRDHRGAMETNLLYAKTEGLVMRNRRRTMELESVTADRRSIGEDTRIRV